MRLATVISLIACYAFGIVLFSRTGTTLFMQETEAESTLKNPNKTYFMVLMGLFCDFKTQ